MSLKVSLTIASLFLVIASTSFAQGPRLVGQDLNGPVLFGPEASFEQVPGVRVAPVPEPEFGNPGIGNQVILNPEPMIQGPVDPNAPGVVVPAIDGVPMAVSECQCEFIYQRVRYKNKGKISPCAQTMVVSVLDPCSRKYDCETKCVQVKICAPTCGCPKVKVSRSGRHTRYDFGKYAIDIYSNRNGTILVDYDA